MVVGQEDPQTGAVALLRMRPRTGGSSSPGSSGDLRSAPWPGLRGLVQVRGGAPGPSRARPTVTNRQLCGMAWRLNSGERYPMSRSESCAASTPAGKPEGSWMMPAWTLW